MRKPAPEAFRIAMLMAVIQMFGWTAAMAAPVPLAARGVIIGAAQWVAFRLHWCDCCGPLWSVLRAVGAEHQARSVAVVLS